MWFLADSPGECKNFPPPAARRLVRYSVAFDEAVGAALDFQRRNPNTLLIVTADHETGGMALIGYSKDSKEYIGIDLTAIQRARASFEVLADELGKNPAPEKIRDLVKRYLAIEITEDEAKIGGLESAQSA